MQDRGHMYTLHVLPISFYDSIGATIVGCDEDGIQRIPRLSTASINIMHMEKETRVNPLCSDVLFDCLGVQQDVQGLTYLQLQFAHPFDWVANPVWFLGQEFFFQKLGFLDD
ncbi:hypothetical protein ACJX0J_025347, partial [Zea mays]